MKKIKDWWIVFGIILLFFLSFYFYWIYLRPVMIIKSCYKDTPKSTYSSFNYLNSFQKEGYDSCLKEKGFLNNF